MVYRRKGQERNKQVTGMITQDEFKKVERFTMLFGHNTVSNYIRSVLLDDFKKHDRAARKREQANREEEARQGAEHMTEEERKLMEEFDSL